MSTLERASTYVGGALLTFSLIVLIRRGRRSVLTNGIRRAANRANEAPVEVLADTLKQAWAPYHTA